MITLNQLIHYRDTNSVEATWVDENNVQVKCHSYADVQMDMLRADLGDDAAEYEELMALVEANIQPVAVAAPVPQAPSIYEVLMQRIEALESKLDAHGIY
jgi:hypothetical protein